MAKLVFSKRLEFAPSSVGIYLSRADLYVDGKKTYAFLTLTNPEKVWHGTGIAKIVPYDDEFDPIDKIGIKLDLSLVPPGGSFTYPDEVILPAEFEGFNFEFLEIDHSKAPKYQAKELGQKGKLALAEDGSVEEVDPSKLVAESQPILPVRKRRARKTIRRVRYTNRTYSVPALIVAGVALLAGSVVTLSMSRFEFRYPDIPPASSQAYVVDGMELVEDGKGNAVLKKLSLPKGETTYDVPAYDPQGRPIAQIARDSISGVSNLRLLAFKGSTSIPTGGIHDCYDLTRLSFDGNGGTIDVDALMNLGMLQELSLGSGVNIGEQSFGTWSNVPIEVSCDTIGTVQTLSRSDYFNFTGFLTRESSLDLSSSKVKSLNLTIEQNGALGRGVANNCTSLEKAEIYCNARNFVIPARAFAHCTALESIYYPEEQVTRVDEGAFQGCGRLSQPFYMPACQYVGLNAFTGTQVREVHLAGGATFADGAFDIGTMVWCGDVLHEITSSGGVDAFGFDYTIEGSGAYISGFHGSPTDTLYLYDTEYNGHLITGVKSGAFNGLASTFLSLPETISHVEGYAFMGSNVASLEIRAGGRYVTFDENVFYGASSLTNVSASCMVEVAGALGHPAYLHLSAQRIYGAAPSFETGLADLYVRELYPEDLPVVLASGVREFSAHTYDQGTLGYSDFVCISNTLVRCEISGSYGVADSLFADCPNLAFFDFSSVTSIGYRSFYRCAFESIELPRSCTYVGSEAFYLSSLGAVRLYRQTVYEEDSFPGRTSILYSN